VILDKVLNSRIGNVILDQLTQVIHTRSHQADKQALRAALVVSASKDRQITLIEVIQNNPTKEVEVEGVDAFAPRLEEKRLVARHRLEAA